MFRLKMNFIGTAQGCTFGCTTKQGHALMKNKSHGTLVAANVNCKCERWFASDLLV
jgi:hypothetical protein